MTHQHAIVIGAGVGGLSTAVRLAAEGWRVTLLEQHADVGGKMGQHTQDGFRWDTGPSVITMRPVLEDVFAAAGQRLDEHLDLLPVEPLTRYLFADGVMLDATRDWPHMAAQIAAIEPRDVAGYARYLAYAAEIHRITAPVFIHNQPPRPQHILRVPPRDMLRVDAWRTMDTAIRGFVRSPHLRQLLGRFATYTGASPYRAPATLNVIADVELTGGVYYPRGGIYAIAKALAQLAASLGVEIRTRCPVEGILVTTGQASGVTLAGGATLHADVVVANVDVATVYERLLPPTQASRRRLAALHAQQSSCSGFILMLGVEGEHKQLAHHNILFSADYPAEFDAIFRRGVPPEDPTIYIAITSKTDPSHAPPGCENWFVLVNAPPLGDAYDWRSQAEDYKALVLAKLAARGMDVRARLRSSVMLTPIDLARLTGARRGALYGTSSNSPWAAFRRPHNRARDVRRLYFVGGTAHPGGGVPMVMLSAASAVRMIHEDLL